MRAWRGLPLFEARSSVRSWLYTIATNTCLRAIARRPRRVLPVDYGPAADPHVAPGRAGVESVWLEPYPDEQLGLGAASRQPGGPHEQREGVELAFIAALRTCPAPSARCWYCATYSASRPAKDARTALDTTPALGRQRPAACASGRSTRACRRDASRQTLRALRDELPATPRAPLRPAPPGSATTSMRSSRDARPRRDAHDAATASLVPAQERQPPAAQQRRWPGRRARPGGSARRDAATGLPAPGEERIQPRRRRCHPAERRSSRSPPSSPQTPSAASTSQPPSLNREPTHRRDADRLDCARRRTSRDRHRRLFAMLV